MKKHFTQFPSIKERQSAEKDTAHQAFLAKARLLNEHTSSQTSTFGALASLLGQLATVKPGADVVSRAEYDSLQRDFLALKQEVTTMKQLRNDLDGIKSTAEEAMSRTAKISIIQQKVDWINRENVAVANWKQTTDTRLREVDKIDKIDQRLKTNETRCNTTQKELDDFKDKEVSKFATKQQINDLETKGEAWSQKIESLQIAQAKATAESLNSQAFAKSQAARSVSNESLQKLLEEHNMLKQDVGNLQLLGTHIGAKAEQAATAQDTMEQTINQLEVDIVDCKDKLNMVRDSVEEEGKEVIVKRVKRLDVLVNNLSSKIGDSGNASVHQRLSQLESVSKTVQGDIRSIKSGQQPQPTTDKFSSGAAVDLTPLETRLSKVERELTALDSGQDEKDGILVSHVTSVEKSLKEQFSRELTDQLSAVHEDTQKIISDSLEKMTNGYQELQKSVNGLVEAILSKADSATVEALKSDLSSVSEDVKKWQAQHQRTKSASQTPTPANHGPQPNGPFQAAPQPQQLPNGVLGSPQVNGVQQPHSPYAMQHNHGHSSTQHTPGASQAQKVDDMQTQINGLVAVTQQLKMRCDNLQTDDIVRSMMEQFHAMYPDARSINGAVQGLRHTLSAVQQQLSNLQKQKAAPSEQSGEDIKKATAKAEGASNTAHNAFQESQKAWGELNKLRRAVQVLENEIKKPNSTQKTASDDSSIRDELTEVRKDLDKTTDVANSADRLSRQHASRFSKIVPETLQNKILAVETRVGNLDTRVGDHDQKLRDGASALEKVESLATTAKNQADRIGTSFGTLRYKVEKLEGRADD
jgi:chromosome segregation ATPase